MSSTNQEEPQLPGVEVDSNQEPEQSDEGFSSSNESSTTSLASSIMDYKYENGRRYHAFREGKYAMPNDETEQERLDIMHHIYTLMLDGNATEAPLENPHRILDIGTGTGIWAMDMGDLYPSAQIIGTDLSPIQPSWVPPNVQFIVDDAESDWMYADNTFDLIHTRGMIGSIRDWPSFLSQLYNLVKPGGYIELFEMPRFRMFCDDGTYTGSALEKYYDLVEQASIKSGRSLSVEPDAKVEKLLQDAGFEKPSITYATLPLGSWPADKKQKELGKWAAVTLESGFEAYGMALLTRVLKMTEEEVRKLIVDCKAEVKSRKIHCYCRINNYVAKKAE